MNDAEYFRRLSVMFDHLRAVARILDVANELHEAGHVDPIWNAGATMVIGTAFGLLEAELL